LYFRTNTGLTASACIIHQKYLPRPAKNMMQVR
jgi:hypothetical protein